MPPRTSRAPSDQEFSDLVHAAWPSLYRTAYLLLGDHGQAEDLVQTALARTYARWGSVRDVAAAPAYARRVVVTTATTWFRRRGFRGETPTDVLPGRAHADGAVGERLDLVAALATLPRRQRAVVVLRFYEDLSVTETAAVLGISEGTVKSQTSHALDKLRAALPATLASLPTPSAPAAASTPEDSRA